MTIEYHTRDIRVLNWQNLAALSLMTGGGAGNVAVGLWAIYVPRADPILMFPLIGSFAMLIVGVGWWLLNRRDLT